MLKRILAVIMSSIIFAFGLSLSTYTPEAQRDANVGYMSLSGNFIFIIYFSLIFYTVIGLPASWILDIWRKRFSGSSISKSYLTGVVLYSIAGIVVGSIFYAMAGNSQFFLDFFFVTVLYGLGASLLYFHSLWTFEKIISKYKNQKKTARE